MDVTPERVGYGNDGEWTPLTYGADAAAKPISAYFRHTFMLSGASRYGALRVRIQRDDAAVVYLNGQELFRDNLADGPITPATMATLSQGGADETAWRTFIAPSKSLTDGKNTVAVEVHQSALNSSDLGLDLEMTGIVFPTLAITRSGSQIVLAIPAGATQWAPETSTTLSGPWSPLTTTPIFVGDEKRYSINPTDTRQFYRLGRTGD